MSPAEMVSGNIDALLAMNRMKRIANQILSVVVLACSKATVALLVISIEPFTTILRACKIVLGLIGVWTLVGIITLAAQCTQADTWDLESSRCVNQEGLYIALGVFHILLDIAIVAIPIALMWRVQMIGWKRRQISALFALRLIVPVITIPGLLSLTSSFHTDPLDRPWNGVMPAIWLQLVQSSSILCTCIPSLKRVLADLQTGMMAGTISEFFELSVSGAHSTAGGPNSRSRGRRHPYVPGPVALATNVTGNWSEDAAHPSSSRTLLRPSENLPKQRGDATVHTIGYQESHDGSHSRASSSSRDLAPHCAERCRLSSDKAGQQ
ncbi:uncharacterized protein ATNIH1004_005493 [Aspergillus tanneri]|uniref:Rhodopsin domain-containing protein n=1 Tax=Aspergillus tanneri TaxID=1220188 RepID=A0A5M9MIK3_9EURO|nr:uncharacterized protein ATNIH1004_005493 [Aspergillus tanneri]KAA8646818.1 hypothetical protein ATNIH1004_005493 [Aspergillus tanneri]